MTNDAYSERLNARISASLARKIELLCKQTKRTSAEVLRDAISFYYEHHQQHDAKRALEDSKFIGCADGPTDLSETYKELLVEDVSRKHNG